MSFKIFKEDKFLYAEYEPQHGTEFLFKQFEFDIESLAPEKRLEIFSLNETNFVKNNFDWLAQIFNDYSSIAYTKWGIKLLKETLCPKNSRPKHNLEKRAVFFLGVLEGDYYRIPRYLISGYRSSGFINFDILLHKDIDIGSKLFFNDSQNSYFEVIDQIKPENSIIIGGSMDGAIPEEDFKKILSKLPSRSGYSSYMRASIEALFSGYFEVREDYILKYKKYLNKKSKDSGFKFFNEIREFEEQKYIFIYERLSKMLASVDGYSESDWQKEILEIVLILFPKYSQVLKEVMIKTPSGDSRRLDFAVLDSDGHLDVIEIKQPFGECLVTKNQVRNNFVPLKELSTTVVQSEKYIYYLNKWGKQGEQSLTEKYKSKLNEGLSKIKITNPKAILILGRDFDLTEAQRDDFEIIKRHYLNVSDIITYDDLLRRLKSLIVQFSKNQQ